jgi:hypothetical protein
MESKDILKATAQNAVVSLVLIAKNVARGEAIHGTEAVVEAAQVISWARAAGVIPGFVLRSTYWALAAMDHQVHCDAGPSVPGEVN